MVKRHHVCEIVRSVSYYANADDPVAERLYAGWQTQRKNVPLSILPTTLARLQTPGPQMWPKPNVFNHLACYWHLGLSSG